MATSERKSICERIRACNGMLPRGADIMATHPFGSTQGTGVQYVVLDAGDQRCVARRFVVDGAPVDDWCLGTAGDVFDDALRDARRYESAAYWGLTVPTK